MPRRTQASLIRNFTGKLSVPSMTKSHGLMISSALYCVALSKYIEDHLNRDEEDYELEVGSAGLGQPFKVPQQYKNPRNSKPGSP